MVSMHFHIKRQQLECKQIVALFVNNENPSQFHSKQFSHRRSSAQTFALSTSRYYSSCDPFVDYVLSFQYLMCRYRFKSFIRCELQRERYDVCAFMGIVMTQRLLHLFTVETQIAQIKWEYNLQCGFLAFSIWSAGRCVYCSHRDKY